MGQTADLDKQARDIAKNYMGEFAWPTLLLGLSVCAAYISVPLLVAGGHLPLPVGALLMVVLTYASYTVLHDAVHGSINGKNQSLRWVNEALGYMAACIMMIPLTAHRHEHLTHHRNTNDPDGDPDFVVADMARSPFHAVRAAVRVVFAQYQFYFANRWHTAAKGQNLRFCLEIGAALGLRLLFLAKGYWAIGLVLFIAGGVGGVMLLMFLFAYIVHRPHSAVGPYVDTSTIIVPGIWSTPVTWLWGYQNYHSIHHLFPRVPFYRYKKLFAEIQDIMVARGAPIYTLTLSGLHPKSHADLPAALPT